MGWFLINVLLPLIASVLVLAILKTLPIPLENKLSLNLLIPVKDGQLCWAAIALSASALYEMGVSRSATSGVIIGYLQGAAVFLIAMSSILVAGGAIFPTSLFRPAEISSIRHFSTFAISLFLAFWAALVRVVVQFGL
jgi:hypothetical protein